MRIIARFVARLCDIKTFSLALIIILISASSSVWAQGPGLSPKTCADGKQRYLCQGDLVAPSAGNGTGALVLIDPVSGAQALISQGGLLSETAGVVVESDGQVVSANRFTGLVRVNPADGSQTPIGSYNRAVNDYFGVTLAPDGSSFIVTDSGFNPFTTPAIKQPGRILLIDKSGGAPQVLADGSSPGSPIVHPYGVATDSSGNIFISDMSAYNNQGAIFELPFIGGNANPQWSSTPVLVWGPSGITGPNVPGPYAVQTAGYSCPLGITVDPTSNYILATIIQVTGGVYGCSPSGGAIFEVDLTQMKQLPFAGPGVVDDPSTGQNYGSPWLTIPFGMLFDLNQKVVFVDEGSGAVFRMDPQTKYLMTCSTCASATWDPNAAARGLYWHGIDPVHYSGSPLGIVLSGGTPNSLTNLPNLLKGACGCGSSNAIAEVKTNPPALGGNPPTPTASIAGAPASSPEGTAINLTSTVTPAGTYNYAWTVDVTTNGVRTAFASQSGPSSSFTFTPNVTGTYAVSLTATPSGGGTAGIANAVISATDVAPTITFVAGPATPIAAPATASIRASFTYLGMGETYNCTFGWSDGTAATVVAATASNGSGSCTSPHTWPTDNVYLITVTVADKNGGQAVGYYKYVVVFDPLAGWVSGNGQFTSPTSALLSMPMPNAATANFGFSVKYTKASKTPTGSNGFQFKLARLMFESTSYQYLSVNGGMAQFAGTGIVKIKPQTHPEDGNAECDDSHFHPDCDDETKFQPSSQIYNFIVTVVEGSSRAHNTRAHNTTPGRYRIKIYTGSDPSENIFYDNLMGAPDDPNLFTPPAISRGEVVIHTVKKHM